MREDEEKKKQQAEEDARKEEQQVGYASLFQHISLCNINLCSLLRHSNIPRQTFWTLYSLIRAIY